MHARLFSVVTACFALGACANPARSSDANVPRHEVTAPNQRAAFDPTRNTEVNACIGLTSADRDATPFARDDIASVRPLLVRTGGGKSGLSSRMTGAVVEVRATRGMTAEWLQRIVDCHVAREGHDVAEVSSCPLGPGGITASVASTERGFAVAIRSDDSAVAQEVLRRAQGLVPR